MLRVRLAKTAHAHVRGSTFLCPHDRQNDHAHSVWRWHKTAQKACKLEHLLQAIKEVMLPLCAWAPQHANSVSSLPNNAQVLAGRLTVLAMFWPLKACSFLRAMAATASSSLSCTTSSLLKPHTVLLRACGHAQRLSRSHSDNMLCQAYQRPNTVFLLLLETQ